ncbi:MAG: hypothetical protein HIU82_18265 [Proteobacteria bacterium]|nr:hypothetical protein [Pseudomonadota bacterium]
MLLVADSRVARETARRRTANGWNTTFIGANRHTRAASEPVPEPGTLYPMAFLVEKDAGAVVHPHFHQADQFQVVMGGSGRLGRHNVAGIAVHYTDAWSAYGPIVAAEDGVAWFTFRNAWDPGARYMPGARAELRAGRGDRQHREVAVPPEPAIATEALASQPAPECRPMLAPAADGMACWRYRLPPGASLRGADPASGRGQFWLVLAGALAVAGHPDLPAESCLFVSPNEAPLESGAGESGAEVLCLQFPTRS